jgi:hypothetical protein
VQQWKFKNNQVKPMKIDIADDHSWFVWSQWDCRGQIKFSSMGYYHRLYDQAYFSIRRKVIMGGYIRETKKVGNLTADRRPSVFGFESHYQHTKKSAPSIKRCSEFILKAASLSCRCLRKEEQDGWLYTWIRGVKKQERSQPPCIGFEPHVINKESNK